MSNQWLRWHIGTCEDGKFRMIARNASVTVGNAIALWSLLLEDASHPEHRGICVRGEDFYCAILDIEFEKCVAVLSAMETLKMISVGHGAITITNWNKRQFETDTKDPTNAERQRRFKERKKQNNNQTDGNASVTVKKHQNTDTDTDTEKKSRGSRFALDHLPDDWKKFCFEKRPDLDPESTFLKFANHWQAKPGKDGRKLDWYKTWQNWVLGEKQTFPKNFPQNKPSVTFSNVRAL